MHNHLVVSRSMSEICCRASEAPCHQFVWLQVVSEPAYREWMDSFGSQTTHLMANSSAAGGDPILASSTRIHARLNVLGPQYFSIPSTAHMPAAAESAAAAEENGGPARPEAAEAAAAADQEADVGALKAVMAAANGKPAESIHPGRNLLKYILVPVGRQGVEAGAPPYHQLLSIYQHPAMHICSLGHQTPAPFLQQKSTASSCAWAILTCSSTYAFCTPAGKDCAHCKPGILSKCLKLTHGQHTGCGKDPCG